MKAFLALLDRLEDQVLSGTDVPLTPWTMVHGDKMVHLLDRLRENLPTELDQARQFIEKRDHLAHEAQTRAKQIVDEAKAQADMMLSESELMKAVDIQAKEYRADLVNELDIMRKQALEEAEMVRARAQEEARQIAQGAERYAETVLTDLEKNLTEFQGVVKNGQSYLRQRKLDALNTRNAMRDTANRRLQSTVRDTKSAKADAQVKERPKKRSNRIPSPSEAKPHAETAYKESMNLGLSDLFDESAILLPGRR